MATAARRVCVKPGDQVIIICAPDPQAVGDAEMVAAKAAEMGCDLILLNPRLASGDAGIGLNVSAAARHASPAARPASPAALPAPLACGRRLLLPQLRGAVRRCEGCASASSAA